MSIGRVDTIVAGAGVVGLTIARALSLAGREVLVIEFGSNDWVWHKFS